MHVPARHTPADSGFHPRGEARFFQHLSLDTEDVRGRILDGLTARPAWVSPKHFYDRLGSILFEAICALPEYYPTRTEAAILADCAQEMAQLAGPGSTLVDLGAGNCAKAAELIPLLRPACYVPVDICADFLRAAASQLRQRFSWLDVLAVGMDFAERLEVPDEAPRARRLFFYPGSSIGNFSPAQARALLEQMRASCDEDGALLIGVDLLKEPELLEAAYDDALGVTAAFNLNLLRNLNRLAGTDFRVHDWRHRAFFNEDEQRVEMHLVARHATTVHWDGGARRFEEGESMHTESSWKYRREEFLAMLEDAGFVPQRDWRDAREWFMVVFARAA